MALSRVATGLRSAFHSSKTSGSNYDGLVNLLAEVGMGVAIYSPAGQLQYTNELASKLDLPSTPILQRYLRGSNIDGFSSDHPFGVGVKAKVINLGGEGCAIVTKAEKPQDDRASKLVAYLLRDSQHGSCPYAHAARALGLASNWQWVGVSRFCDSAKKHNEFLGWWDNVSLKPAFNVCERTAPLALLGTGDYFNASEAGIELESSAWPVGEGVVVSSFGGSTYNIDNLPGGQIIAFDSDPVQDLELMQAMQKIVAEYLAFKLDDDLKTANVSTDQVPGLDPLTRFGTRLDLRDKKKQLGNAYLKGKLNDLLIIDIELLPLASWRDEMNSASTLAYAEMIRRVWRADDCFFRTTDTRFQLLIPNVASIAKYDVVTRIDRSVEQVLLSDECVHAFAYGISFLSESKGKFEQAELLAAELRQDMSYQCSINESLSLSRKL